MRTRTFLAVAVAAAGLAVLPSDVSHAQAQLTELNFYNRTEVTVLFTAMIIKPGVQAAITLVDAQCVKPGETKIWNVEAAPTYYASMRVVDPDCGGKIRFSNAITANARGNSVGLHLVVGFLQWK